MSKHIDHGKAFADTHSKMPPDISIYRSSFVVLRLSIRPVVRPLSVRPFVAVVAVVVVLSNEEMYVYTFIYISCKN